MFLEVQRDALVDSLGQPCHAWRRKFGCGVCSDASLIGYGLGVNTYSEQKQREHT